MEPRWTLELIFKNNQGESHHMAVEIAHDIAREFNYIQPFHLAEIGGISFAASCEILKRKQFRKDSFTREATRLGVRLAEYMEDKEGWHGEDRKERA